jgi:hypothetical protein
MRIYGPNGAAAPTSTPVARRSTGTAFTLTEETSPQPAGTSTSPRPIGGIETLLALQGVEEPTERRRRAVRRGRTALDALDELKMGLLAGTLDQGLLARLKVVASGLKDGSGDPGLDGVLAEIELRVEVELAKMATPPAA